MAQATTIESKKPQRAILVIDPSLHADFKSKAAKEQVTLQKLTERLIRAHIGKPKLKRQQPASQSTRKRQ